jgi:ABC-type transport system substrate-binding protein
MTPFPPNSPLGELIMTQLREIGITAKINNMERAAFNTKRSEGIGAFPDGILLTSGSAGTAANQIRTSSSCKGSDSRTCLPAIDERLAKHDASVNLQEREQLLKEIQEYTRDEIIFVPFLRNVFVNAQGPRIANKPEEIWGAFPQFLYMGPFEDVKLKE